MFYKNLLLFFFCVGLLALSCGPKKVTTEDIITSEINSLTTNDLKSVYLEKLYKKHLQDQSNNVGQEEMLENAKRIGAYLEKYGYPKRFELGGPSADAPIMILRHYSDNALRHKYFPYIYKGFLSKDISPETFAIFLGKFQKIENGQWIEFDRPFTTEEEIDTLLKALKLDNKLPPQTEKGS